MQALSSMGWKISIFRIKAAGKPGLDESLLSNFLVLPVMLRPTYWFRGLIWTFRKRYSEFCQICRELSLVKGDIRIKLKLLFLLFTVLGMAEYINVNRISITHIRAHFLHNETVGAYWLSKILHISYSITIHTTMIYYPYSLLQKAVQNASFCVGISEETLALATKLRGNQDNVFLIRNGVNFDVLQNNLETSKTIPIVLAVGRLIPKKGFDVLIKACALLKQRNINFLCRIIGAGSEFPRLKKLIVKNGLSEEVHLAGALPFDQVVTEYQKATLLVVPSRVCKDDVDGLPTVMIEALAMGLPVIASSIAGIPDLIKEKQTGLLVPAEDEKSLANAICDLFFDENLYRSLALQGKNEVLKNFNISETIKQLNNSMVQSLTKPNR
jgi:glycosyltransferase involved in cell wall biosynthesis